MDYKDMTNKELAELVKDFDLTVEAANPGKPNKTELIAALDKFKAKQDAINGIEPEVDEDEPETTVEPTAPVVKKPKKSSKVALIKADLLRKERVIINDNQTNQTKDEMISVSWGNRKIGVYSEYITLTGEPQYIRRGALGNLKDVTFIHHEPKANGSGDQMLVKPRFSIVPVAGMTEDELKELGNKQAMRNAKYA